MPPYDDLFLGAYVMAPAIGPDAELFWDSVSALGVGGLEFPLLDEDAPTMSREWLAQHLNPEWSLLVTCVPTTTARLPTDPVYGLASTDEDARQRALRDTERAARLARDLADDAGHPRVEAIQVHSAPGPQAGDGSFLARSLEEILGWDLGGARLLVEHCDAPVAGQRGAKEYLHLPTEIAAIVSLGNPTDVGLSVNWGRSAIETRSTEGPTRHVHTAVKSGLLGAVVFSGATDQATAWGRPWSDSHIPPRGDAAALEPSAGSLLGRAEITEMLAASGGDHLTAVKIGVHPAARSVAARIAVATAALDEVVAARRDVPER